MISRFRRATLATAAAAVPLALLAPAPQASAHATLQKTVPGKGDTVTAPRKTVRLTFDEDMQKKFAALAVTDPKGRKVATGKTKVSGRTVQREVEPFRGAGKYRVGWRAVSADGHPVSGRFSFTVAKSAVQQSSSTATPSSPSSSSTQRATDDRSFVERHAVHLLIAALVIVVGVALVVWERRRRHD